MGGAPRIIRKIIKKDPPPAPSSPIVDRRAEVAKKTEAEAKKLSPRKLKRRASRTRTGRTRAMVGGELQGGDTMTADYSPIRNPRDGSKLGSA